MLANLTYRRYLKFCIQRRRSGRRFCRDEDSIFSGIQRMSLVRYKKMTMRRKLRHHECDVGLCRCAAVPVVVVGVVVVSVLLVVDGFTPQSTTQQLPKDLSRPNECCRRPTTSTTTTLLPQHTSQQRRQQQQSYHCNVKRPRQVLTRRLLAASEEQPSSSLSISQNSPQRHRTTRSMRSTKATTVSTDDSLLRTEQGFVRILSG